MNFQFLFSSFNSDLYLVKELKKTDEITIGLNRQNDKSIVYSLNSRNKLTDKISHKNRWKTDQGGNRDSTIEASIKRSRFNKLYGFETFIVGAT